MVLVVERFLFVSSFDFKFDLKNAAAMLVGDKYNFNL